MFNFDFAREAEQLTTALGILGFHVVIHPDNSLRPIQTGWSATTWKGRPVAATMTTQQVHMTGGGDGGNRQQNVPCLELSLAPLVSRPVGFGASKRFDAAAPRTVAEAFPPDHAAFGFHPKVKDAFVQFVQPRPETGSRRAPSLRITDRSVLEDYLPPEIHPMSPVIVIHSLEIVDRVAPVIERALDMLSWIAQTLEETEVRLDRP